ncbi:MAG: hypothetical protein BWY70_01652 [Bacteroidetes bacterium ADurb.Bin408]|nr:MAG: hypothetical protein BWY70_01652 [Bacteroidetes bacterium ADurb.Bin408]
MNTKQPQSILSSLFPNKAQAVAAEIAFLFIAGIFAAVVQQYLKVPMHLPGKQGLLFMLILTSVATLSRVKGAASITTGGAAVYLLTFQMASGDIYKPLLYIMVGITLDAMIILWQKFNKPVLLLAVAGALSWATIPFTRLVISSLTGVVFKSFMSGLIYPFITHLIFGFIAALIAGLAFKKYY